jgi:hypothetical protein
MPTRFAESRLPRPENLSPDGEKRSDLPMSRSAILAAIACAALTTVAQAQTTPQTAPPAGPPPEAVAAVERTATAFSQCVQSGIEALPANVTAEAGATSIVNGCAAQRRQLEQAALALIATIPEAQQAAGREQLRSQMGGIEPQVAEGIRRMRAAAAAAPAATPAPAPGH